MSPNKFRISAYFVVHVSESNNNNITDIYNAQHIHPEGAQGANNELHNILK